jgi:hypothetical protein
VSILSPPSLFPFPWVLREIQAVLKSPFLLLFHCSQILMIFFVFSWNLDELALKIVLSTVVGAVTQFSFSVYLVCTHFPIMIIMNFELLYIYIFPDHLDRSIVALSFTSLIIIINVKVVLYLLTEYKIIRLPYHPRIFVIVPIILVLPSLKSIVSPSFTNSGRYLKANLTVALSSFLSNCSGP